jgi:hypothetical protein
MKTIIYTAEKGNVATCYVIDESNIDAIFKKIKSANADAKIIEQSDLPNKDQDFFNAWELVNGNIIVNIEKAKEIAKEKLRNQREPLLAAQDIAFQRALELKQDTKLIVEEKQRLRDITKLVDNLSDLDEIRAITC